MASSPTSRGTSSTPINATVVSFVKDAPDDHPDGRMRSRSATIGSGEMSGPSHRRMSMPQPRHANTNMTMLPSSPSVRIRATSGAGVRRDSDDDAVDDEWYMEHDEDRSHNLTFDGVKEGAYMLCKRSDDLLGHHARQVFREKAASMRGENSIYYYLKELMKKFGADKVQKKGLTSEQIVLQAHEFRKMIASDAAFQAAIPEQHIDALFHRMEHDDTKTIRHLDFVEFCLFDHHQLRLLLFKFRKALKQMRLSDNEITDTFRRLTSVNGLSISPSLLHAAIARELDVVLTTGELRYVLQLLDLDGDGEVKVHDFEAFVKDERASFNLIHPSSEIGIVDLKLTMSEADESNTRREGYTKLSPGLQGDASAKVHLWYKSASRDEGKSAISSIRYAPTSRDSDLVSKGYTCLQQDVNRAGAFGKHKYIWLSYVPPNTHSASEIIDMCLSTGELDDTKDANLWLPMYRGFKLIPGDLNDRSSRNGVFLWIRRRPMHALDDLADDASETTALVDSPRSRTKLRLHADELEAYVRQILRRNCPTEQDGAVNFARLFDEFDQKKTRSIGRQAMLAGIESVGIKMKLKDFPLIWDRINASGKKTVDVGTFTHFLEMTDAEIDETVNALQRTMTTKSVQQGQLPNYRTIFQSYNSLGDGRLSRADFQRMLAGIQINFSNSELSKIIQRFDVNRDGVVDYADFLRYVTGFCDAASRTAKRVADAAEEIKSWAMEKQNKKLAKDGQIDSSASWKLLKPKRGILDVAAIDRLLRERLIRLDTNMLRLLRVLMSPATNGEINQAAYHAFVNHQPRKTGSMVYDIKKVIGPIPGEGDPDGVYDRLNVEGNGRLSLVTFAREINALAAEKNMNVGPFDLKDFVYVVQWSGADCGGDGFILIDRFLAAIRDNAERRHMKHEYITNYDSPRFIEGVKMLRDELRRCAKTPDGKFNYRIPFKLFDKDNSGQIILSEFETAVRELDIDKCMSDQEIKSLMRRFDLNASGGISYDEFLRFNMAEATSKTVAVNLAEVEPILVAVLSQERLTPATITPFCSSMKRMFSIMDKDTHGVVSATQFAQTLNDIGVQIPPHDMEILIDAFSDGAGDRENVCYSEFCESLLQCCERIHDNGSSHQTSMLAEVPTEVLSMLCEVHREFQAAQAAQEHMGKPCIDLFHVFGIAKGEKGRLIYLQPDEFKEKLWDCGVRHPFLREELEAIIACFSTLNGGFNASAFCAFVDRGPSIVFGQQSSDEHSVGVLDGYVSRLHDAIATFTATGGADADDKLSRCFHELDRDGSGTLSHEEFVHVLHKAGLRRFLTQDDERILLDFLDSNGDGVISYREFVEFAKHGDRKLNTLVDKQVPPEQQSSRPPSPARSPSPSPSPPRSPQSRPPSPLGKNSSKGAPLNTSPRSARSVPKLVLEISKLNEKLRVGFPFEKYFAKYRMTTNEGIVTSRVFAKIMDKFLARLVENNIGYKMHELDPDSVVRLYEKHASNGGSVAHYSSFLADLTTANNLRRRDQGRRHSGSSDDDDKELSCSSDEGESKQKRVSKFAGILTESLKRQCKSKQELEALRTKLKSTLAELEKEKKDSGVSEQSVFKMLARLGLRMNKKEAESILKYTSSSSDHHRTQYDLKKLGSVMNEQLGVLLGDSKAPASSSSGGGSTSPQKSASKTISTALSDKIYRGFIASAQQNISGRRLLEKCDTQRTGMVPFADLQAVLRLIGCVLTENELSEIKSAFGVANGSAYNVNYRQLVRQLTKQLHPASSLSVARAEVVEKPRPIQVAPLPQVAAPVAATKRVGGGDIASTVSTTLTPDTMKRLDTVLRPYFQELFTTRRMDTASLKRSFEPYDTNGSGFVTADAVHAVLRKFDVWLTEEMTRNIFHRFSAPMSGKFDYIDFSSAFGSSSSVKASQPNDDNPHSTRGSDQHKGGGVNRDPETTLPPQTKLSMPKSRESSGWNCNVCLHTQTRATSTTCEICGAQNPASVQYETLLQCSECGFRNRASATQCDLCRLPLTSTSALPSSPHKSKMKSSNSNLRIDIPPSRPSQAAYDESWLA